MNSAMMILFLIAASLWRTSAGSSVVMPTSTAAISGTSSGLTPSSPVQVSPAATTDGQTSTPFPSSSGTSFSSLVLETPTLLLSPVGSSGTSHSLPSTTPSSEAKISTSKGLISSSSSSSGVGGSSSTSVGLHPCAVNNGGCEEKCEKVGASYMCLCDPGYELERDQHSCTDVDECEVKPIGHNCTHKCVNTIGSYACACKPGFKLEMDGHSCELIKVFTTPASHVDSPFTWTWIVLGIVIGLVMIIVILVAGVISRARLKSIGKGNISESNAHEMNPVKGSPITGTVHEVELEP